MLNIFMAVLLKSLNCIAGGTAQSVTMPSMSIPRRIGQNLMAVLAIGRTISISFKAVNPPTNSFDNLAEYSSQGPTGEDNRVKPDIVAPGTITSAETSRGAGGCGVVTYGVSKICTLGFLLGFY